MFPIFDYLTSGSVKCCLPVLLIILLLGSSPVRAQQFHFRNYSVEEGLAQSQVYALCEDSRGFLWLGTRGGGLSRFDGLNFKTYTIKEGLSSNYIFCITEDKQHRLLIGTNKGLSIFDGQHFENHFPGTDSAALHIQGIAMDQSGLFWLASNAGIYTFDGKNFRLFDAAFSKENIVCVFADSEGTIWAGSGQNGLLRIRMRKGKPEPHVFAKGSGLGRNAVPCITENKQHQILAGTYGMGPFVYKAGSFVPFLKNRELDKKIILSMHCDGLGHTWFATLTDGVCRFNGADSSLSFLTEAEGLGNNHVRCILEDSRGDFWFGTSGGGLSKYGGQTFSSFNKSSGLSSNFVYSIFRDSKHRLWIGSGDKGLCVFDGKGFRSFSVENGFRNVKVKAMAEDSLGRIWFGTEGQGIYVFDENELFSPLSALRGKYIRSMLRDSKQNIWVATAGAGIFRFSSAAQSNPALPPVQIKSRTGAAPSRVNSLTEDQQGRIWYGAETAGIGYIENDTIEKTLSRKDGLLSDVIRSIVADKAGYLWAGTGGEGLSRIEMLDQKFSIENYTRANGLNSLNIYLIQPDAAQNLFIGTESGLDKLVFDTERRLTEVIHSGKSEGFAGIETCQNACFRDSSGIIWFGTVGGLTEYNPHKQKNRLAPQTRISGISLFYEPIEKTAYADHIGAWGAIKVPLEFPYKENHIGFDFCGINLSAPENVVYRWRLKGFDKSWSPPGTRNNATYSNLPPGEFCFEVESCNEDGVWNTSPASLPFVVLKPFWMKAGFLLGCLFVFALLVLFIFRWRVRRIRQKAEAANQKLQTEKTLLELEQKALRLQMNPHFIFNALNSIQSQISENNEETARHYLAKFSKLMRMILENSRNAFITLEEEIKTLENYLSLEKFSSNDQFDYVLRTAPELSPEEDKLPPMMIQPFVENAIIHGLKNLSGRGQLQIDFSKEGDYLVCRIRDNGIGRERAAAINRAQREEHHKSTALVVTQERLDRLNRTQAVQSLEISDLRDASGAATGTLVIIRIPLSVN
jgi:ligand-binding sensor domain-containing protein/two-component sensor histidine kinase